MFANRIYPILIPKISYKTDFISQTTSSYRAIYSQIYLLNMVNLFNIRLVLLILAMFSST